MSDEVKKPRRRSPGQGTVDVLPSGKHRVRLTTGAETRVSLLAETAEEAESLRRGAIAELADGGAAAVGGLTLAQWGPNVLDKRELAGARNIKTDRQRWGSHIVKATFATWPIVDIRARHVREWVEELRGKKTAQKYPGDRKPTRLSSGTIKHCLTLLRQILRAAVEAEILVENPAEDVKPPPKELRTEDPWTYLTPDEQQALLSCQAIPEAERCLLGFAIGTGMRQGELWNLELRDLYVEGANPFVFVRFGSKGKPPKNGKMRRVPLFGLGLVAAKRWLTLLETYATKREKDGSRSPHNPHGLVFPTQHGYRRQKGKYGRSRDKDQEGFFRSLLRAASITRPVRFHDLRHTCASSLVAGWWGRTWRLEEVRDLLGHSSVTVTERYAHLAESALRAAATETHGALTATLLGRSREGHALSDSASGTPAFPGRATQDSNLRPSAPESDGKELSFRALSPARDLDVTIAARRLLEATIEGSSRQLSEGLAENLAESVLATPEVRLALIIQDGGPHMVARAIDLARRIVDQAEAQEKATTKARKGGRS